MRPVAELEDILNDRGWFNDPNPTTLLRQAKFIDATETLFLELIYSVQEESHIVLPIDGDTGEGKSTSARKILAMIRRLKWALKGVNVLPLLTFSPVQTVAKVRKGVLSDSIPIWQDEHRVKGAGKGAATNDWALKNIEHTLRANKNDIIICSPEEHSHQHHAALKARGYDKETGTNILLLRGCEFNLPLGYVYLDNESWPLDPEIEFKYNQAKMEYNELVKKYGGIPPEVDPDIIELAEDEMLTYLEKHHKDDMYDLSRIELEKIYAYDLRLFSGYYMQDVLTAVLSKLKQMKRSRDRAVFIEEQERLEEYQEQQEELIEYIAPRMIKYFLEYTDPDKMTFPPVGACKDYLKQYRSLDKKFYSACIDRARHLWLKITSNQVAISEAMRVATEPPPIQAADFSTEKLYWFNRILERDPDFVMTKYIKAYQGYYSKDVDYRSHSVAAKTVGVAKRTLQEQFEKIDGAIKHDMGYEFERTMAQLYDKTQRVIWIDPPVSEVAPKGVPDRVMILDNGICRVCSWKCHNENPSIQIANSPELKMARYMKGEGKRVVLVLEGLYEGKFFSVVVDPDTNRKTIRLQNSDFMNFPPNYEELFQKIDSAENEHSDDISTIPPIKEKLNGKNDHPASIPLEYSPTPPAGSEKAVEYARRVLERLDGQPQSATIQQQEEASPHSDTRSITEEHQEAEGVTLAGKEHEEVIPQ